MVTEVLPLFLLVQLVFKDSEVCFSSSVGDCDDSDISSSSVQGTEGYNIMSPVVFEGIK